MKVVPFSVPKTTRAVFRLQEDRQPHFYDKLHQHSEIQLMLILSGEGTLIAGDYVGRFGPGDLFLIGSNQPHVFRNDDGFYKPKSRLRAHALSLYFDEQYAGEAFWQLEEVKDLRNFLHHAGRGFRITGTSCETITDLLTQMKTKQGVDRVIAFLEMLKALTQTSGLLPLSVSSWNKDYSTSEGKRMNDILQFTFRESHRKIFVAEAAQVANLSTEAFCRYFKTRTQKTYTNFLNEVRVSNACKLLITQDLSIQEVCYRSGFQNLSNFNRIFKRIVGKTPSNYLH